MCEDNPSDPNDSTPGNGNGNGSGNGNGNGNGTNPGYVDPTPTNPNPGGGTYQTNGDREPVAYNWRNKLSGGSFDSHLQKTTPQYVYDTNGALVPNPDAFNCHYHTFSNTDPSAITGTLVSDGMPKWVIQVNLANWNYIRGNIKVGDIIMYYGVSGSSHGWTHSGIVTAVDAQGYATEISSKMGEYEIITHHPRDIPPEYGTTGTTYVFGGMSYPSRAYYRKK